MTTDLARQEPQSTALANPEDVTAALTHYLGTGDLSRLPAEQRAALYLDTCSSLGINPRTRPFDWIEFYDPETKGKKLTLYPNKACADQLAFQHQIRVRTVEEKIVGALFKVVVEGTMPNGRSETAVSYLDLTDRDGSQLKGQRLGNAFMKGHTKAKRRLVFAMLGMMAPPDPDELQQARIVTVDGQGNVLANPTPEQKMLAENPSAARVIGEPTFEDQAGGATIFEGSANQRPAPAPEPQRREGPPPSFRCNKRRWLAIWSMLVADTDLERDAARHDYIAAYTATWPEAARTSSLSRLLDIITDVQAQTFIDDTREHLAEKAAAEAADPHGELDGIDGLTPEQADAEDARQRGERAAASTLSDEELDARFDASTERVLEPVRGKTTAADAARADAKVAAAASIAGMSRPVDREEDVWPEPLDPARSYTRPELVSLYGNWAERMKTLDATWRPDDVKRLPDGALRKAVSDLSAEAANLADFLARFDSSDDGDQADD